MFKKKEPNIIVTVSLPAEVLRKLDILGLDRGIVSKTGRPNRSRTISDLARKATIEGSWEDGRKERNSG